MLAPLTSFAFAVASGRSGLASVWTAPIAQVLLFGQIVLFGEVPLVALFVQVLLFVQVVLVAQTLLHLRMIQTGGNRIHCSKGPTGAAQVHLDRSARLLIGGKCRSTRIHKIPRCRLNRHPHPLFAPRVPLSLESEGQPTPYSPFAKCYPSGRKGTLYSQMPTTPYPLIPATPYP